MPEIQPAKIPEVVDIKDADPDRKELYGKVAPVFAEERRKAQMFVPGGQEPEGRREAYLPESEPPAVAAEPPKPKEPEIPEEDKRAFVRSILANRVFEKVYPLFGGQIEVTFVDRTTAETDKVFERLGKLGDKDDNEWSSEADMLCLCSTLREIKQSDGRNSFPPTDDYEARKTDIKKLPRPLYEALVGASRDFEELINHLIAKARASDFWSAGGSASPSKRTAGMR